MIIVSSIVCLLVPVSIVFNVNFKDNFSLLFSLTIIDILFLIDIIIRFNTTIIDEDGNEIYS